MSINKVVFVIFSQLDMALSTHQLDSNQDIGSLFFKHPSNIFISGPSGSGKTEFVKKMIEFKEDLFDILPQRIDLHFLNQIVYVQASWPPPGHEVIELF